ncbi:MAG: phosphoethanolamine--lipid A transferase [Pseudomonadota bacterium]
MWSKLHLSRPGLRIETVVLLATIYMVALTNSAWWSAVTDGRSYSSSGTWFFIAACFCALVALHFAIIAPIANRWTVKPLLSLILVAAAAASYFIRTYSVVLDPTMLQNVIQTDAREAKDLITGSFIVNTLVASLVPVVGLWWVRIDQRTWMRAFGFRLACIALSLVVAVISIMAVSRDLTSLLRNQRELRYLITPGNVLIGLARNAVGTVRVAAGPRKAIGTDARIRGGTEMRKPRLIVLVLGETARAENFSLLGYSRETNPELAKLNVISYRNVKSCGTSTAVSVPCMFSRSGRGDYDEQVIRQSEGLLNVLARAGYVVKWLDNQSGCKGVCEGNGIEYRKLEETTNSSLCVAGECLDEILVTALRRDLEETQADTVIVLHMMGNHGPAYFKRYPENFRKFVPDCRTAQLRDCERSQIVNTYDNAILYTDHVLANLISSISERSDSIDTAFLYVSDHGESLGENGLYLHGIPYLFAPSQQTHVPMIAWYSQGLLQSAGLDESCVRVGADAPLSHDNLFDTVLGLADVESSIYDPKKDFLRPCRAQSEPGVDAS